MSSFETLFERKLILITTFFKGGVSDTVSFVTNACEPDQPVAPKLITRSKTSIQLKWNAPNDNGAHIQQYILECDEGSSVSGHFLSVFEGKKYLMNYKPNRINDKWKPVLAAICLMPFNY